MLCVPVATGRRIERVARYTMPAIMSPPTVAMAPISGRPTLMPGTSVSKRMSEPTTNAIRPPIPSEP